MEDKLKNFFSKKVVMGASVGAIVIAVAVVGVVQAANGSTNAQKAKTVQSEKSVSTNKSEGSRKSKDSLSTQQMTILSY